MKRATVDYRSNDHGKAFTKKTLMLDAGKTAVVGIGAYDTLQQKSDFRLIVRPQHTELIGHTLEMIKIPGSNRFMGFFHLHNYGDSSYEVTISRVTAQEKTQ